MAILYQLESDCMVGMYELPHIKVAASAITSHRCLSITSLNPDFTVSRMAMYPETNKGMERCS